MRGKKRKRGGHGAEFEAGGAIEQRLQNKITIAPVVISAYLGEQEDPYVGGSVSNRIVVWCSGPSKQSVID